MSRLSIAPAAATFLAKGAAAGALTLGAGRLLIDTPAALAGEALPAGDAAILKFLAAAELLEADLWKQYNELGGVQDGEVAGGSGNRAYTKALAVIDKDMHQYIHDNADDEQSHADFINSYLQARGEQPINLDPFRTLPSSKATGAAQIGRLTNLMELTVDTSYWTRYRSDSQNPDLGDTLPQAVPGLAAGKFPAIPRSDDDLRPAQASAGDRQHGGLPLRDDRTGRQQPLRRARATGYRSRRSCASCSASARRRSCISRPGRTKRATLRRSPTRPTAWSSPTSTSAARTLKPNRIMPEPTVFLDRKFAICSILRPTETVGAAVGAVNGLAASGLFTGQSQEFFTAATALAKAADAATRS